MSALGNTELRSSQIVAEILAADIRDKFLWMMTKSGFHFICFLIVTISWLSKSKMLSTIRGTTKAITLYKMNHQMFITIIIILTS